MKLVKREIIIFLVIFVLLTVGMHFESWVSHPLEHIKNLSNHVFVLHPLVYTFIAYVIVWFLRLVLEPIFKKK